MELTTILKSFTPLVPRGEIERRARRFQELLQQEEIDAALIFHPPDLYYLSGTKQEGFLYIPAEGSPTLLIQKFAARAEIETPWEVRPIKSLRELPKFVTLEGDCGIEMDLIPVTRFERIKRAFPEAKWKDISPLVRKTKAIKSTWEIRILKDAGKILIIGYEEAKEALIEGISELELASKIFMEMRIHGHESGETMRGGRMDPMGQVLSGISGAIPSYMNAPLNGIGLSPATPTGPSKKRIRKGEPVVMDSFGSIRGYLVDMTRTLALDYLPSDMTEAYAVLLEMHQFLRNSLKPEKNAQEIYEEVVNIANESPFRENFMGYGDYRVNFIGHGVGTEIDEYPFIAKGFEMKLEENMVVAVEPKFLFSERGAVGLENTYLITQGGGISLTPAPEELFIKKGN